MSRVPRTERTTWSRFSITSRMRRPRRGKPRKRCSAFRSRWEARFPSSARKSSASCRRSRSEANSAFAREGFPERGLCRGKPRDRHAIGRAGHVVEPDLDAEGDRGGIAAMLAANAELNVFPRLPAARGRDPDKFTHAFAVDRYERVDGKNAFAGVNAEKARGVVA